MFLIVREKSRTCLFPMFGYEQVYKGWEGAQPGSQPKLANGNFPHQRPYAQYINGVWPRGAGICEIREICKICEFCEFHKFAEFHARGLAVQ